VRTITFYSYKGGTGRSLLLANMARLLAGLGKGVVAVDFDLEAPGLVYKLCYDTRQRCDGLVGWLRDAFAGDPPASLEDYLLEVALAEPLVPGGWLKLLPCGRAPSPNYFQDLLRLRLDDHLDTGEGTDALIDLQARLMDDLKADFILLDARTGITATNAVTTQVLADEVVVLALDAPEQLEGTRSVLRALQPLESVRTGAPIRLHVVLSRLPVRATGGLEPTDDELRQMDRVRDFLNEPAEQLPRTLTIDKIHPLHTDPELLRREFVSYERPSELSRSVLHAEYGALGKVLFGPDVETAVQEAFRRIGGDPDALEDMRYHLLAISPDGSVDQGDGIREPSELQKAETRVEKGAGATRDVQAAAKAIDKAKGSIESLRGQIGDDELARQLADLGRSLSGIGRRDEAKAVLLESVSLYRGLADAASLQHGAALAGTLRALGAEYTALGRHEDARDADAESVAIYRGLAAEGAEHERPLALSLRNLAIDLLHLDASEESVEIATELAKESCEQFERLAEDDPAEYGAELAHGYLLLAAALGQLEQHEEAASAASRGIELFRRAQGELDRADLADALDLLAGDTLALEQPREALDLAEEAVEVRRQLAEEGRPPSLTRALASLGIRVAALRELGEVDEAAELNAQTIKLLRSRPELGQIELAELAVSLNNRSIDLMQAQQYDDAAAHAREAAEIHRRLVDEGVEHHRALLAGSLGNLATALRSSGREPESLEPLIEAAEIQRELAEGDAERYDRSLGTTLNNLAGALVSHGRLDEALEVLAEGVEAERRAARREPEREMDLGVTLMNFADTLRAAGKHDEAVAAAREASDIYRRFADQDPAYRASLALSLARVVGALQPGGHHEDALGPAQQAVEVTRELAKEDPSTHSVTLSHRLGELADVLGSLSRYEDAANVLREVIALRRELREADPGGEALARALHNLSVRLGMAGRPQDAVGPVEEAIALLRDLAAEDPPKYEARLASSLLAQAQIVEELGDPETGVSTMQEALELLRRAVAASPGEHEIVLASSLTLLARRLRALGRDEEAAAAEQESAQVANVILGQRAES
jgi:tetratricopeptide (TPR) repeat protein/cellulose biosynthesis protein BcsQ